MRDLEVYRRTLQRLAARSAGRQPGGPTVAQLQAMLGGKEGIMLSKAGRYRADDSGPTDETTGLPKFMADMSVIDGGNPVY